MAADASSEFWSWAVWVPILVTLFSGTVSALTNKVAYDTPIDGTCGRNTFAKAYFFTLAMFIGEALCLLVYYVKQFVLRRRTAQGDSYHALEPAGAAAAKPPIWVYAVLCCFDLSATAVGGVGLIWVDASSNQMLRGSMVVFCAIFSVLLLKRRLSGMQWSAIALVCLGLILVGLSGMLRQKYDPSANAQSVSVTQLLIGIVLVLLASALNAVQNVFEEKLLKAVGGAEVDPLELVGWEGVFGTILSSFLLLPVVYYIPGDDCGRAEDTLNTLKQLQNSPLAVCCTLGFIIGLMLMNWTSQQISQRLSAVHRNLVSAVRTVLVWVGSIILYYTTVDNQTVYGEAWTKWSLLELSGFAVLVGGTVFYSYAGLKLAQEQKDQEAAKQIGQSSPDYVLPTEPSLREHSLVIKQQSFKKGQNGSSKHDVAMSNSHGSRAENVQDTYDEDD